jgi:hypothetical protein
MITVLGSETVVFGQSTSPTPQTVTVPVGTTAAYVFWETWTNGTDHGVDTITLNSVAPDFSNGDYVTTGNNTTDFGGVYCFLNPASGSRSLNVVPENTLEAGPVCFILYVSGDDGLGFRDVHRSGEAESNAVSGAVDSTTDDLMVAFHWGYSPGTEAPEEDADFTLQQDDKQLDSAALLATAPGTATIGFYSQGGGTTTTYNGLVLISIGMGEASDDIDVTLDTAGSITVAGQTVDSSISGLDIDITIDTAGVISVGGQAISIGFSTPLSAGAVSVVGQAVDATIDITITQGSITVAGQTINSLISTNVPLDAGSIAVAGQTLSISTNVPLSDGSVGVSGQTLNISVGIPLTNGSIAVAGSSLLVSFSVPIGGGQILVEGQTVNSNVSGGDISVDIDVAGSVSVTGSTLSVSFGYGLDAGSILVEGQTITTTINFNVTLDSGSISVLGQELTVDGLDAGYLIDGATSYHITVEYGAVSLYNNGTGRYFKIGVI